MTIALSLANLNDPATAEDWDTALLGVAKRVGLPTTTWQTGGIERSVFAVVANVQQEQDVSASLITQAGFLNFAASGFVTYVDLEGATVTLYVTPDPSIPAQNPTGALGWLDVLADGLYDVQRVLTTFAGGVAALVNTSGTTYGPFAALTYHVGQPLAPGAPSYSNAASLTLTPSIIGGTVTATAGFGGVVKITTAAPHPFATGAPVYIAGVNGTTEANGAWYVQRIDATHFLLLGSTWTNAWTSGGTVYVPTIGSFIADAPGSASSALAANLVTSSITSLIGVSVGNLAPWIGSDIEGNLALAARCRLKLSALSTTGPLGAYIFWSLSAQQQAPLLTPPQIVAANITRADARLDFTTGTVILTLANAAGAPSASDVAAVRAVVIANAVLFTATLLAQAAVERPIAAAVTVYLPATSNTAANALIVQLAAQAYGRLVPIGGVSDGTTGPQNVVPVEGVRNAVEVALRAAGVTPTDVQVTLTGGATTDAFGNAGLLVTPIPEVAVVTVPAPTMVSV